MREIQFYDQGDIIMREGATEDWMYRVISGSVGIYADYERDPRLITTLSKADFFGEMGLIEKTVRSATAVALSVAQVERIDEADYLTALQDDPKTVNMLLGSISNRIAVLSKDYAEVCEAISEYVRAEEQGLPKSQELMRKMQHIVDENERRTR